MRYCGEYPLSRPTGLLAQEMIQLCIDKEDLRDEFYAQLCKQTTQNPDM